MGRLKNTYRLDAPKAWVPVMKSLRVRPQNGHAQENSAGMHHTLDASKTLVPMITSLDDKISDQDIFTNSREERKLRIPGDVYESAVPPKPASAFSGACALNWYRKELQPFEAHLNEAGKKFPLPGTWAEGVEFLNEVITTWLGEPPVALLEVRAAMQNRIPKPGS